MLRRGFLHSVSAFALLLGATPPLSQHVARAAEPIENGGAVKSRKVQGDVTPGVAANVNTTDASVEAVTKTGANWLATGQGYLNQRYSPLKAINSGNVGHLAPVAIAQTGYTASFETTPIVVNGVMYVTTPMVNSKQALIAMNAATGETLWTYTYSDGLTQICCGPVNRGATISGGQVYFLTIDNSLVDVDAVTGKEVWKTKVADAQAGYSETMTPQVYDHQVIIGSAGGEWPIRGFVASYDAANGTQTWR